MHACSAPPKATQINCVSWPGDLVKVDDKVSSGGCGGWIQGEGPCFGAPGIRWFFFGNEACRMKLQKMDGIYGLDLMVTAHTENDGSETVVEPDIGGRSDMS